VRIEEGRVDVAALGVDHLGAVGLGGLTGGCQLGDAPVADDDVVHALDSRGRVEHRGAPEDQLGGIAAAKREVRDGREAHAGCPIVGVSGTGSGREGSSRAPRGPEPARSS
jgi:hypothetical protein